MGVPRKQYTPEFKREAVRLVMQEGHSVTQVARDLGLNDNMLHRWKKEFAQKNEQAFPGQGHSPEDDLTKLRREVEVLRREREILKKPWVSSRNTCPKIPLHRRTSHTVQRTPDVPCSQGRSQWVLCLVFTTPNVPPWAGCRIE